MSKGEKKVEYFSKNWGGVYVFISYFDFNGDWLTEWLAVEDKKAPAECKTIIVKNLAFDSSEDDVKEYFSVCGEVENVRFVKNRDTSQFRG